MGQLIFVGREELFRSTSTPPVLGRGPTEAIKSVIETLLRVA